MFYDILVYTNYSGVQCYVGYLAAVCPELYTDGALRLNQ